MPGVGIGVGLGGGGSGGLSETGIAQALASKGLSDAQARASVGAAASVAAGLRAIGLSVAAAAQPAPAPSPTPAPTATSLPAGIVARWDAASLAGLGDGGAIARWTDAVGGAAVTQGDSGRRPTFRTGGQGGKPYVLFGGGQFLDGAPGSAASAAYTGGTHTTLCVLRNVAATTYGRIVNGRQSDQYPAVVARGNAAGGLSTQMDTSGSDFVVVGTSIKREELQGRGIVNGTMSYRGDYQGSGPPGASDYLSIGGAAYTDVSAKCELYEVIVWNTMLTQHELLQAMKSLCDKYAAPYPWGTGPFRVFDGDSIMCNYNAVQLPYASYSLPNRVATIRGWKYGSYSSVAQVGISMAAMHARAAGEYDGIAGLLGVPVHVYAMEYANQRVIAANEAIANTRQFIAARKAAGAGRVLLGTATAIAAGTDGYDPARRAAYNGYDWLGTGGASALIDVGGDARVGAEGANPGPNFSDALHPSDAGYAALASLFAAP